MSAWIQLGELSYPEQDALRSRLLINAVIEYLVRVMERESKNPETFAEKGLDKEQELTLNKIINSAKTGFSVVAHQLTILDFLLHRSDPLNRLPEAEREQLQTLIKNIQQFVSTDSDNYYGQLMTLLLPVSKYWNEAVDFNSPEHQAVILNTVLEKFHARTVQPSDSPAKPSSESPMCMDDSPVDMDDLPMDTDGPDAVSTNSENRAESSTIPGQTFSVFDAGEYEALQLRLQEQLEKLKLCKNVPVEEDGLAKYQQSCHYCGDSYTTRAPLYETETPVKMKRQKKGFIYRGGMPLHQACKQERQADTQKALTLIKALENNYPYVPPPKTKKTNRARPMDI